jgi:hypothetical protein
LQGSQIPPSQNGGLTTPSGGFPIAVNSIIKIEFKAANKFSV